MELRQFLERLRETGNLLHISKEIPLNHIAALLASTDRTIFFERVEQHDMPLVGNVAASRRNIALAFGCEPRDILPALRARLEQPPELKTVTDAPVKARIVSGDEVDLTRLPLHLQHEKDGAPYISAAVDVTHDPEQGRWNLGMRRLMFQDRNHVGIDLVAPSDLMVLYRRYAEAGKPLEIAFLLGVHPLWQLGALIRTPIQNELHFLAKLAGQPLELIPCETIDLKAPAAAEIILEGRIGAAGYTHMEGPYGEFLGAYGTARRNPLVEITAVTCRHKPIFQSTTISGPKLARTETSQLSAIRAEHVVWEALRHAVQEPVSVYCPPAATQVYAIAAIRKRFAGEGKNALLAMLSCKANVKQAVVVDDDIDIFDHERLEWALGTRMQPSRDVFILNDVRCSPIDPSITSGPPFTTSKMGIDATRPFGAKAERFAVALPPFHSVLGGRLTEEALQDYLAAAPDELPPPTLTDETRLAERILARLAAGPATYLDLLEALPSCDQRLLLRTLGALTQSGRIQRDDAGRLNRASPQS